MFQKRVLQTVSVLVLAILVFYGVYNFYLQQQNVVTPSPAADKLDCHQGLLPTLSIQQAANVLDMPLIEVPTLADNVEVLVSLSSEKFENPIDPAFSFCRVSIRYALEDQAAYEWLISILIRDLGKMSAFATPEVQGCTWIPNNGIAGTNTSSTHCDYRISAGYRTLQLSVHMEYSPEFALTILDTLRVVYPNE